MSTLADKSSLADSLLRAVAFAAAALLVAAAALLTVAGVKPPLVERVQVRGALEHVPVHEVQRLVAAFTGASLLRIDLDQVRQALETLPWVAGARVRRVWPDTLQVQLHEHRAVALWRHGGLLAEDGRLFVPPADSIPQDLPLLEGPAGQEQRVLESFRSLSTALQGSAFMPVELRTTARGAWTARTAEGVELRFGRGEPAAKAGLLLGSVGDALVPSLERVAYIDLRYSNGFAVGWRDSVGAGEPAGLEEQR